MSNVMAGKHVVVNGASVAGLLAARVLSESFDQVTVYDWYLHQFRKAASVDPVLGRAFVRVVNMIDPPAAC